MSITFEKDGDVDRWMQIFSRKAFNRAKSAKVKDIDQIDIYHECIIAWCKARDLFKPELGIPFKAYLFKGVKDHVNKFLDKKMTHAHNAGVSIDEDNDEENTFHDIIPSDDIPIDQVLIQSDLIAKVTNDLSDLAKMFLGLLINTPEELLNEHEKIMLRNQHACSKGIIKQTPKFITESLVIRLMGLTKRESTLIKQEISEVISSYE